MTEKEWKPKNNRVVVYGSGGLDVKEITSLVNQHLPSALIVSACRRIYHLRQVFLGYVEHAQKGEPLKMDGKTIGRTLVPEAHKFPQPKPYLSVDETGQVKYFINLDGKPFEVDTKNQRVLWKKNPTNPDKDTFTRRSDESYIDLTYLVRTKRILPDLVLMRSDGYMSWSNGEASFYNIDRSKVIKKLSDWFGVKLLTYESSEDEHFCPVPDESGSIIKNKESLILKLQEYEKLFAENKEKLLFTNCNNTEN